MKVSDESTMIETGKVVARGRPKGSTGGTPQVETEATRCPKCGSTQRDGYFGTTTVEFEGEFNGRAYKRIVSRRTACVDCGQHRIDRTYQ